jgi:hypothetical protein
LLEALEKAARSVDYRLKEGKEGETDYSQKTGKRN